MNLKTFVSAYCRVLPSQTGHTYDLTVSGQVVTDCHHSRFRSSVVARRETCGIVLWCACARSYDCDLETWILCFELTYLRIYLRSTYDSTYVLPV
jgi:hypothetical protein